jgi:hypothetical protein
MSLGALVDESGNDHYSSGSGQGSGIHITNAILIDKDGHDIYEGRFRSGGSGGDRTPSFLIDYHGNDTYKSNRANYAAACKPFAIALFIDYEGNDIYICPNPEGPITMNNWTVLVECGRNPNHIYGPTLYALIWAAMMTTGCAIIETILKGTASGMGYISIWNISVVMSSVKLKNPWKPTMTSSFLNSPLI